MRLYKWMLPGLITPMQNKPWPVAVGEWTPVETPVLCESGFHGVQEKDVLEHLPRTIGAQLWVVEVKGQRVNGADKFAASQMKLVECIGVTTEENLRLFAADCAEDVLDLFEDAYPDDTRPRDAINVARRYALGQATREELAAARAAAGDAAWAAGDAARAAARDAARARYSNWLVVRIESGE